MSVWHLIALLENKMHDCLSALEEETYRNIGRPRITWTAKYFIWAFVQKKKKRLFSKLVRCKGSKNHRQSKSTRLSGIIPMMHSVVTLVI